jgi:hypothetical protein
VSNAQTIPLERVVCAFDPLVRVVRVVRGG